MRSGDKARLVRLIVLPSARGKGERRAWGAVATVGSSTCVPNDEAKLSDKI